MKTIPHSETRDPLGIRFDILSYEFLWTASFFVLKLLKSETYAHNGNMRSTYISYFSGLSTPYYPSRGANTICIPAE